VPTWARLEPLISARCYPGVVTKQQRRRRDCLITVSFWLPALTAALALSACSRSGSTSASGLPSTANPPVPPGSVTVRNVVGKNYPAAQLEMATTGTYGLNVGYRFVHASSALADEVVAQSPRAGATAKVGSEVTLSVSIGPADVPGAKPWAAPALRAQLAPPVSEATGQHTLDVSLTNTSRSPCVLEGYPVVELLDANGHILDFKYLHEGDPMTTRAEPSPVYLPPKAQAWARVNKYRCDIASTDTASTVVLELPRNGGNMSLAKSQYPVFAYCQEAASLTVTVSPFEPVELLLSLRWG
jgi:hypothetical protein